MWLCLPRRTAFLSVFVVSNSFSMSCVLFRFCFCFVLLVKCSSTGDSNAYPGVYICWSDSLLLWPAPSRAYHLYSCFMVSFDLDLSSSFGFYGLVRTCDLSGDLPLRTESLIFKRISKGKWSLGKNASVLLSTDLTMFLIILLRKTVSISAYLVGMHGGLVACQSDFVACSCPPSRTMRKNVCVFSGF